MSDYTRSTKYVIIVRQTLKELGHASNAELFDKIKKTYPKVSLTTIHRVTKRLKERNLIGCAPKQPDGVARFDYNATAHHHFMCNNCFLLCDIAKSDKVENLIKELVKTNKSCGVIGNLTIKGQCKNCWSSIGASE